ncbi:MAG TPA: hypothetical protein VLG46_05370 [Anaerolineae bacterium]|nr:hypothetical protein [Anaerolineae bacterium]
MTTANGALSTKTSSSSFPTSTQLTRQEALLLLGLGAAIVALVKVFDLSLKLPGHTGIVWLALLLIGRTTSNYRWAASVSGVGSAVVSLLPLWGFGDPLKWLSFLLVAVALDVLFNLFSRWQHAVLFLAVSGSLAHAVKPLSRILISSFTGLQYTSLLTGALYPLAMHLLFGFIGALVGVGMVWGYRHLRNGCI